MSIETTIIYYTDNSLEEHFAQRIREYLLVAAEGKPIISVSHEPVDLGRNICVGKIPQSHHSLFYQILKGGESANTKYIALAEHDCLYTPEHFNWIPSDDNIFWYNLNHWFVQWQNKRAGQYSQFRRKALSQLICERQMFLEATREKLHYLETGFMIRKGQPGACEYGIIPDTKAFNAEYGVVEHRKSYKEAVATLRQQGESLNLWVGKDLGKGSNWKAKGFRTKLPNIDIRHKGNFSGNRRGKKITYFLPYWGSFDRVMGEIPPGKWYQEATINRIKMPTHRRNDTSEKRWKHLIEPLFINGHAILELGCNAGYYLRQAKDRGYEKAVGIEKDNTYLRQASFWESCEPKGIKLIAGMISPNFDWTAIPMVDLCLMANFHYWLTDSDLKDCISRLKEKTVYCLVTGRDNHPRHTSNADKETLIKSFSGWKIINQATYSKFYSVLFKNRDLDRYAIEEIYKLQQLSRSRRYEKAFTALIQDVLAEREPASPFYEYTKWRKPRYSQTEIDKYVAKYIKLIKDVSKSGLNQPLILNLKNHLLDGDHRIMIAKQMGWNDVIARKVQTNLEAREWLRKTLNVRSKIQ